MLWLAKLLMTATLLPGFLPAPVQPAAGTLLTGTFPGTLRPGYVFLPPGYSSARRYPVVYLLHGMPGSPSEYIGGGADITSWAADNTGLGARPFIAVIPAAGTSHKYNGEWAGPWETALVQQIVPWVDAHLSTIASPAGRVIAGLSAGGYGAADIALRNPTMFGRVAVWSGYFHPLHDGPFKGASKAMLAANDPTLLARANASTLRREGMQFFLSTGPSHSHWYKAAQTPAFARELRALGLTVQYETYAKLRGEWHAQVDSGLAWAFG